MGLPGCQWDETRSSRLPELLKPKRAEKKQHNPLSDALHKAEIFRRMVKSRTQLLHRLKERHDEFRGSKVPPKRYMVERSLPTSHRIADCFS